MNFTNTGMDHQDWQPIVGTGYLSSLPTAARFARDPSVFSLPFDKFHSTLGGTVEEFGSMDMGGLFRNIWSAGNSQSVVAMPDASNSGLQIDCSIAPPRATSVMTLEEVKREYLLHEDSEFSRGKGSSVVNLEAQQRHPAMGEVKFEEIMEKTGNLREEISSLESSTGGNNCNSSNSVFYGDYTLAPNSNGNQPIQENPLEGMVVDTVRCSFTSPMKHVSCELETQQGVQGGGAIEIGCPVKGNGMLILGGVDFGNGGATFAASGSSFADGFWRTNGDVSSLSPANHAFDRGPDKKCRGMLKADDKRQKRMIKNRESAARSRARKQAHTSKLEAEVQKLMEQNRELKKKQEILEVEKNQALEIVKQQFVSKHQRLRRTRTSNW